MNRPIRVIDNRSIQLRRPVALILFFLLIAIGGGVGAWFSRQHNSLHLNLQFSSPIVQAADRFGLEEGLTPIVDRVLPAVVSVYSEKVVRLPG